MSPWGSELNGNEIHNFFSGEIISYVFWIENGGMHGIWAFWHFLGKTGHQKYSGWLPTDQFHTYES